MRKPLHQTGLGSAPAAPNDDPAPPGGVVSPGAAPRSSAALHDDTIRDVAREARTALDSILGFSELVAEDHPGSAGDVRRLQAATRRVLELVALLEGQVDTARAEASRDPLTGVANRRSLITCGEAWMLSESPLSLLLIDVDRFKEVNDRFGHLVGDEVLRILVDRCRRASRETDLVARFAGDEFVILLPSTHHNEAEQVAARLVRQVAATPFQTTGGEIPVSISVGVASREPADPSVEALLRRADDAMYAGKHGGRPRAARE